MSKIDRFWHKYAFQYEIHTVNNIQSMLYIYIWYIIYGILYTFTLNVDIFQRYDIFIFSIETLKHPFIITIYAVIHISVTCSYILHINYMI